MEVKMPRRKKSLIGQPKTKFIANCHFIKRLRQRYPNLWIDAKTAIEQTESQIQNRLGFFFFKESNTRTHWVVKLNNVKVIVVYNKEIGAVTTALPWDEKVLQIS
jgi:hypothetical protein